MAMNPDISPNKMDDPSIRIAETVIRDLSKRNIPLAPENYTVWYHYLSGKNPDLSKAVETSLKDNPNFSVTEISTLYEQFFGNDEQNAAIELISEQLVEEMKNVLDNLSGAHQVTGNYGESLASLSGTLTQENNLSDLHPAISAVVTATQKMADENQALGNQLSASSSEISQLRTNLEDMRQQAMTDGLTGIANRKCFDQEMEKAIQYAQETDSPVCLLMLDIDHFKKFNDTHGHQMGDRVLQLLARILKDTVKGQDTPARYGGEEFSIILPETELNGAVGLANSLRERVFRRDLVNKSTGASLGKITFSVGASQYQPKETSEDFIARADKALYEAKKAGRDRVITG